MSASAVPDLPAPPAWLTTRDGSLEPGIRAGTVFVVLGGQPQYRLDVRPAQGKYCCVVVQTVNAKRLDDGTTYPTADDAVAGGLDQLREVLGW